MEPEAYLV